MKKSLKIISFIFVLLMVLATGASAVEIDRANYKNAYCPYGPILFKVEI